MEKLTSCIEMWVKKTEFIQYLKTGGEEIVLTD